MHIRTELMRTPFNKSEPKPTTGPRQRKCKICRSLFSPRSSWAKVCGPECAEVLSIQDRQAKERKADRVRKQALKTKRDYEKEAQIAFNAYIRARDSGKPCICCGRFPSSSDLGLSGHAWDCGHYRSVGSAPHLRFTEDNAHRQLVVCNRYGAGRAVDYRLGLIARIGLDRVEALESNNAIHKWTIEELKEITKTYKAKLKALKALALS